MGYSHTYGMINFIPYTAYILFFVESLIIQNVVFLNREMTILTLRDSNDLPLRNSHTIIDRNLMGAVILYAHIPILI